MEIIVNEIEYKLIEDERKCFNKEEFLSKVTDYFEPYDYIFGDYAYEKLRLKGFYDSDNENVNEINDIKNLEDYKNNYCSFAAKTFLLKKVEKSCK